jgi:chemotaxis protein methyltransferase CheR
MGDELVHLLDAISTNGTSFFRENHHFELVRKVYEQWLLAGQTRFRMWSSASSTGEEPYSLAMTLADVAERLGRRPDVKILATDISTRVLHEATEGLYPRERVATVPNSFKTRFFTAQKDARGQTAYRVSPQIRSMIVFRRMNLSQPPFVMHGPMDFVFCRNVMIYFDQPVRLNLLREFHRLLRPDGYLMVGHSESLTQVADLFDRHAPSVYQPVNKA